MPGTVTVTESQGQPTIPASADFAVCVVGYTSANPLGAGPGPMSPAYSNPATLVSGWGLGDAVDAACQAITQTQGNPAPPPVCIYSTPATTEGVRGETLTTSGVLGTAVITKTAGTHPVGTFQPVVRVLDDGADGDGGLIGTAGIVLQASLDAGRTWLASSQLGTAFTYKIQLSVDGTLTDTGVEYTIAPATTNADYVSLGVEIRADVLAHLADVTAHDAADTSAAQVALAASSVPATVTATTAVMNLARAALIEHYKSLTSHDGPDIVNALTLGVATDTKTGIDLAIQIKAFQNLHRVVALASAPAGLKAATASVASITTYTAAAAFLAGGVAAMDLNPRRPIITVAGVTPSDAPATATWDGFDLDGAAQSEVVTVPQTATSVIATKAYKGTGLSVTLAAADGTAATLAFGYSNGVHNSADTTNVIGSADPTYGTLKTGDTWSESKTTPPMWGTTDLYSAGPPAIGAFAGIAASSTAIAIIVLSEPVAQGDIPTLTLGLNYLASSAGGGKRCSLLIRFRDPTAGETDAQYLAAFATFRASNNDNRIGIVAGSGWLTDAFRAFVYFRSGLPAVLARLQSMAVVPGKQGERMAQHPGYGARGPLEGFSLVDGSGNPIAQAHDEAVSSGIDGPFNGLGGGIGFYYQKRDTLRGTYVSEAPVMYPSLSAVLTWMDRRVMNGIEMVAETIAWTEIQGADIFDPITFALDEDIRDAIQTKIAKAIRDRYASEFQNAADPNLVSINETVSVSGSQVTIGGTVNVRLYGYTQAVNLTFSASR